MRASLAIIVVLLSGCSSTYNYKDNLGYRAEDPCIRCGERWDQLPNPEFDAQRRRARGEQW